MDEERDLEVFERIPWDSLTPRPDRRWLAYLLAAALVLGAVGVSLGRQMGRESQPVASSVPVATPAPDRPPTSTTAQPAPPETTQNWSEADLMALPGASLEASLTALAEWYVVDFFSKDEPGGDRSFVEWAGAEQVRWESPSAARVTVLVRRLAARGDDPYQRLPTEAWEIALEPHEEGWAVVPGPVAVQPAVMVLDQHGGAAGEEWTDQAGLVWHVRGEE